MKFLPNSYLKKDDPEPDHDKKSDLTQINGDIKNIPAPSEVDDEIETAKTEAAPTDRRLAVGIQEAGKITREFTTYSI